MKFFVTRDLTVFPVCSSVLGVWLKYYVNVVGETNFDFSLPS